MTLIDYSRDEDDRALEMHDATEAHVKALRITWGLSRKDVLEHLIAFAENDDESPAFTTAPGKPRKRARKIMEAREHV